MHGREEALPRVIAHTQQHSGETYDIHIGASITYADLPRQRRGSHLEVVALPGPLSRSGDPQTFKEHIAPIFRRQFTKGQFACLVSSQCTKNTGGDPTPLGSRSIKTTNHALASLLGKQRTKYTEWPLAALRRRDVGTTATIGAVATTPRRRDRSTRNTEGVLAPVPRCEGSTAASTSPLTPVPRRDESTTAAEGASTTMKGVVVLPAPVLRGSQIMTATKGHGEEMRLGAIRSLGMGMGMGTPLPPIRPGTRHTRRRRRTGVVRRPTFRLHTPVGGPLLRIVTVAGSESR